MHHGSHRGVDRSRLIAPAIVAEFDVMRPPPEVKLAVCTPGRRYNSLLVLVTRAGTPIGTAVVDCSHRHVFTAQTLLRELADQLDMDALPPEPMASQPFDVAGITVTVVVTTCAMAPRAVRCLRSIFAGTVRPLEVVLVENRPARSNTAKEMLAHFGEEYPVVYVEEVTPGLSRARNRGLREARGEVVVFTDDDVVVAPGWVEAIAGAFARSPTVSCVTGPILPLSLETDAQVAFEQFGNLSKGFRRQSHTLARPPIGDPLFPYAAGRFGSGANIAMRREIANSLSGFDVQLGAGTLARGGEDLDLFLRLLRSGGEIVYEPCAHLRHEHSCSERVLRRHAFDYGVGLGAVLTKQLRSATARREVLSRVPAGLRYLVDDSSPKNAAKGRDYPSVLDLLERLGMAVGPAAYLASVMHPENAVCA